MTKSFFKKSISLFLAVLMVATMLPVTAIAEEIEGLGCTHHPFHNDECGYVEATEEIPCAHACSEDEMECAHEHDEECGYVPANPGAECTFHCEKCEADVLYSNEELCFSGNSVIAENGGNKEITLYRENAEKGLSATVVFYDYSANYEKDYAVYMNGEKIEKIAGSKSFYDAFAEDGEAVSGIELDAVAAVGNIYEEETPSEDMKASEMFAEFDSLGIRAAEIPVTFAPGESEIIFTVEPVDDSESEYDESFMVAVFDKKGEVVESAQALFTVEDDEADPEVKITFDCAAEIALGEDGKAEITFKREGNLATNSLAVLFYDGEPLGYVDFAPYQTQQSVEAVYAGVYMLGDENGNITDTTAVVVYDPQTMEYTVPEGADPELDAIPDSYASIPDMVKITYSDWFPEWAKNNWLETKEYIINMGKLYESRWENYSNSSKGSTSYFPGDKNEVHVNTSGDGSHLSSGTNKVVSKYSYDVSGIEKVEVVGNLSGVDKNAKIGLEVDGATGWHNTVTSGGTYTMIATLPAGYRGISRFYVYNRDPQVAGGGTNFHITNGWRLHKRLYYIEIKDELSSTLSYYGGENIHPTVGGNNDLVTVYPHTDNTTDNKVNIIYTADTGYPAKLVGFKLYKNGKYSELIKTNNTNSFYFTFKFLKNYEANYSWFGDADGKSDTKESIFTVVPVFEKIGVTYSIKAAKGGTIELQNPDKNLYQGDYAVFKNSSSSELKLTGVEWRAYTDLSNDIAASGIMDADADGLVRIKLNGIYTRYEFKGVYSADATSLSVFYAEEKPNGKLGVEGIIVPKDKYVKNDYVTISAQPDNGYITKWLVDTDVYYGNVLYYQLTGNPDYNKIYVSFVKESSEKVAKDSISGILNSSNVNLKTKENNPSTLSGAEVTVTADQVYTVKSSEKGTYFIPDFKGVVGGTYTALITYGGGFAYKTFTFGKSDSYYLTIPQFAVGESYPVQVSANLSGGDSSSSAIPLEDGGTVNVRVSVQGKDNSKPVKVTLYFYDTVNNLGSQYKVEIKEKTESIGDISYWDAKIPAEDIPFNTRLYLTVDAEKTVVQKNDETGTVKTYIHTSTSALADGGYEFSPDYEDSSIPVYQDVPSTPQPADASEVFAEKMNIPLLGRADFSLSSSSGGFFVTRTDPDTGCIYLMCGYSFEGLYSKGNIVDKYDAAKKSGEQAMKNSLVKKKSGNSDPEVQTMGGGQDNGTAANGAKKTSPWTFSPVFMFKIAAKPGTNDPGNYYISGYETIVGFDTWFYKNFPYNISGFPLYVSVSFSLEAVLEMAMKFKDDQIKLEDADYMTVMNAMGNYLHGEPSAVATIEGIIGAPKLAVGVKGGAGLNNFLSIFLTADVRIPILLQFEPEFDIAGEIGFNIGGGADVVIFTGKIDENLFDIYYGDDEKDDDNGNGIVGDEGDYNLIESLKSVQGKVNTTGVRSASAASENEDFDFEEAFNNMTFSLESRTGGATLRGINASGTVSENTFKNTGVHLWEFESGKLGAAFLKDNGSEGLNYLSAVYAVSNDGGKTWTEKGYFSDNTYYPGTSLQYDINIFELEDRILVTWSEADFDKLLSEMDITPENLTATQVAKFMGAMNLRGAFIDKYDGNIIGETFTIAENSTVACGVLDAVQSGENVYVYYQRNAIPQAEEFTVTELLSIERTIAVARANVNETENWVSTAVRVENENGQQYRITGVEPFSHNGILGEVIVLDRNGKISVQKADGTWESSDDDRMLFLRTYTINEETGAPEIAVLTALTGFDSCAQSPEVVSNGEDIYLFYNENGNIVYLENFVADENDSEEIRKYSAFAVKNSDGSYSVNNLSETSGRHIASHGSIYYGTKFTATMDNFGDILLCWIADEQKEDVILATEEIYGVMLRKVTNGKVFELLGVDEELTEEEALAEQLWAVGSPVAITDENGLFGALDSICTDAEKGEFLLGYTRLNSNVKTSVTAASVKVTSGNTEPKLVIEGVDYYNFPTPGTETNITVTVKNEGFKPVEDIYIGAFGNTVGADFSSGKTLWPGKSESFDFKAYIPEDFDETEKIDIIVSGTNEGSVYSAESEIEFIYGAYFTVDDVWQTSIPGTKDVNIKVSVTNIGNASGKPEFTVRNSIFGAEDDVKEYFFSGDIDVEKGSSAVFEYVLEDTYINKEQTAQISVRAGEYSDQFIQEFMPKPAELPDTEDDKPEETHNHSWSAWFASNGIATRKCSTCGAVETREQAVIDRTENEENPATGSVIIVFEKAPFRFFEDKKANKKSRAK